jgi:hypothetical protein
MKAQAMTSPNRSEELEGRRKDTEPDDYTWESPDEDAEADENELDECDLDDDDGRWDVFILDDDGETLPEYGDFWFPD